jgi:predicted transcriptional regulator
MNVTNLAKALDLTTQETSRLTARLQTAGLLQRTAQGLLHVTPYGELVLRLLPGFQFLSTHRRYFTTHTLRYLPSACILRLGELTKSTFVDDVMVALHHVETVIQEAQEYIWAITDQHLLRTMPLYTEAFDRGVTIRNIEARDWVLPEPLKGQVNPSDLQAANQARQHGKLEERVLNRLDVYLYMSEREVAGIAFPRLNGRFDYFGFSASNEQVHHWCQDLFTHYWNDARPRTDVIDEAYWLIKKNPQARSVLMNIALGQPVTASDPVTRTLEEICIINHGKLTLIGDIVYQRLTVD